MENESANFGPANMAGFMDDLINRDRRVTAERLEHVSARLADLAARIPDDTSPGDGRDWSVAQVVAHIAGLSAFFCELACKTGTGAATDVDMLKVLQSRDAATMQRARQTPVPELVAMAQAEHRRALDFLRSADTTALRRRVSLGAMGSLSAEEVVRLGLCTHVEEHVDQLDAKLGT